MSAAAYAIRTALGDANSRRAAAFGILALGFLGMEGGRRGIRIPLCSSFPESADERKREEYAAWEIHPVRALGVARQQPNIGLIFGRNVWENYWEIIADNLSKAGFSWGCVSARDSEGR